MMPGRSYSAPCSRSAASGRDPVGDGGLAYRTAPAMFRTVSWARLRCTSMTWRLVQHGRDRRVVSDVAGAEGGNALQQRLQLGRPALGGFGASRELRLSFLAGRPIRFGAIDPAPQLGHLDP